LPAFDRSRFAAILPVSGAGNLAVANGRLWVLTGAGTVVRLDPATNRVVGKPLRVPADTAAIAAAQGALWVTTVASGDLGAPGKDTVARIDLATGRTVATVTVPRAPLDLAATPRAVWVTNAGGDGVARIDPRTNRPRAGRSGPAPAPRAWPWGAGRCGWPTTTSARSPAST
jgi:DNA-binding beta-propeller fold protein YncE